MAYEARVKHLYYDLERFEMHNSIRALDWMIAVMNAENGYKRHDGSHYYYHLVDSTQDLLNHGIRDKNVITGCILHDSVEDIPKLKLSYIAKEYGMAVALLVQGVTKLGGVNYKEGDNLQCYLDNMLPHLGMCLIKTADRKHNFSTLEDATPEKELRQARETKQFFLPFFKEARKLHPDHSFYFHSAKTTIMPHLKKILKTQEQFDEYEKEIARLKAEILLLRNEVVVPISRNTGRTLKEDGQFG